MSEVEVINNIDVTTAPGDVPVVVVLEDDVEVIQTMEQGPPGPPGAKGDHGDKGEPGNTVLYGAVDPTPQIGIDGNFYINTATHVFFGPKWLGVWPAGTSMIGPQGPQGIKGDKGDKGDQGIQGLQGIQGVPGADGNTVLYGAADPVAGTGVNGNFYINTTTHFMFGPKASGAWPAGTSLVGPQGPKGDTGPASTVPGPPVDTTYLVRTDAAQVFTDTQAAQGRRNIFAAPFDALAFNGMQINGSHDISQDRTPGMGLAGSGYFCDGWGISRAGTSAGYAFVSVGAMATVGIQNCLGSYPTTAQAVMGAADFVVFYQFVEGNRVARLQWGTANAQPLTLCFWSSHHQPGLYTGVVKNGAATRCYAFSYTHDVADVAQFNVVTIPGDITGTWAKDNTTGLALMFAMACGATYTAPSLNAWGAGNYVAGPGQVNGIAALSDYFRIGGVLLLPGTEAPPKERSPVIMRPPGIELPICQRYWEQSYTQGIAPGTANQVNAFYVYPLGSAATRSGPCFKVTKRAAPTVTIYAQNGAVGQTSNENGDYCTPNQAHYVNDSGFYINLINGSVGSFGTRAVGTPCYFNWIANARL